MPLTLLEPFNLNTGSNYTFNSANVTANIAAGNLAVTGVSNLGAVGNVVITGGSNGQVLTTNGSGGLSWTTVAGGGSNISNGNSNVSIATANGNITMSVAGNANVVTVTGTGANIAGTLNATGVVVAGAVTYANTDGTNGQVLTTYGNGISYWSTVSGGGGGGANIANGNSNINIPAANGNITVSVTGNSNVAVFTETGVNVAGNLTVGAKSNLGPNGNVIITGGTAGHVLSTDGSGNLSWIAQGPVTVNPITTGNAFIVFSNATSGTFNAVANASISANIANGAVIANTFVGMLANGNTDVNIPAANGNISFDVSGNANVMVITGTGANLANITSNNIIASGAATGNANASTVTGGLGLRALATTYTDNSAAASATLANAAIHAIGTPTLAAANATVTATNAATFFIQNAPTAGTNMTITNRYALYVAAGNSFFGNNIVFGANSTITMTGASSQLTGANLLSASFLTGTLTTASQPNITSLGTLGSLSTTGNVSVGGNLSVTARSNLGPAGNVIITGGTSGAYLQTDGAGNLVWAAITGGTFIANGTSSANIPAANGNIVFDVAGVANVMTVTSTGISNTRINLRVANNGATTSGNITPNASLADQFNFIGLTGAVNIAIPSGTFIDGQKLLYRFKDDGNARTLNWTGGANGYRAIGVNLPSTTSANKVLYVGCVYNSQDSYWDVVSVGQEI